MPDAALLLVGDGPYRGASSSGSPPSSACATHVVLRRRGAVGGAAGVLRGRRRVRDALPDPQGGLEVEGLGIVYLEASAIGLPVVAGDSGGAPDAVQDGVTGYVVDGRSPEAIADRVSALLLDRSRSKEMGEWGRRWVEQRWTWDDVVERLQSLLRPPS